MGKFLKFQYQVCVLIVDSKGGWVGGMRGSLYKRTCDKTWKNIVSAISSDKDYIVYDKHYYTSDEFEWLDFYRKHNLPIPTKHPEVRHLERISSRTPRKIFDRTCDECWINIKSSYNQDRKEKVVCEKCYNKLIY